jgi:hypothetical protein
MSQKNKGIKVNHILLEKDKFQIMKLNCYMVFLFMGVFLFLPLDLE